MKKLSLQPKQRVNSEKSSRVRIEKQVLYTAAKFHSSTVRSCCTNFFLKIAQYALFGYHNYIIHNRWNTKKAP